jgi:hypothetical protein
MECMGCGGTGFGGGIDDLSDPLKIRRKSAKSCEIKKESSYEIAVQAFLDHRRKGNYKNE